MTPLQRKLLRFSLFILGILAAAWFSLEIFIYQYGKSADLAACDCIIILGTRALADGTPGPNLKSRCDWGAGLYQQGWASHIICTGGRGQDGTVESVVSKNYLVSQKAIPAQAIFVEEESHNTRENFRFAQTIVKRHQWKTCLVVTDPFHQYRSIQLARQFGLEAHRAPNFGSPAWTDWNKFLYYQVRESFSLTKFVLEGEEPVRQ